MTSYYNNPLFMASANISNTCSFILLIKGKLSGTFMPIKIIHQINISCVMIILYPLQIVDAQAGLKHFLLTIPLLYFYYI